MAKKDTTVEVERKQGDTPFWLDVLTNRYNGERQIQINETYVPKDAESDDYNYGRKTVNINIIDVPAVVTALVKLYEDETGKEVTL